INENEQSKSQHSMIQIIQSAKRWIGRWKAGSHWEELCSGMAYHSIGVAREMKKEKGNRIRPAYLLPILSYSILLFFPTEEPVTTTASSKDEKRAGESGRLNSIKDFATSLSVPAGLRLPARYYLQSKLKDIVTQVFTGLQPTIDNFTREFAEGGVLHNPSATTIAAATITPPTNDLSERVMSGIDFSIHSKPQMASHNRVARILSSANHLMGWLLGMPRDDREALIEKVVAYRSVQKAANRAADEKLRIETKRYIDGIIVQTNAAIARADAARIKVMAIDLPQSPSVLIAASADKRKISDREHKEWMKAMIRKMNMMYATSIDRIRFARNGVNVPEEKLIESLVSAFVRVH